MKDNLLSIFIPTYKREFLIQECISSFIDDARELNIQIYISMNGPNQNVKSYLEKINTHGNIHVFEHTKIVPLDESLSTVLKLNIDSKYVLMLADDDLIEKGGLKDFHTELNSNDRDYSCIILNGIFFDKKGRIKNKLLSTDKDIYINDPGDFLKFSWDKMHYSSIIMNVNKALQYDLKEYYKTSHIYTAMVVLPMTESDALCWVRNKELIRFRSDEKTWSDVKFKVYFDHIPYYYEVLPKVYEDIISDVIIPNYINSLMPFKNLLQLIPEKLDTNEINRLLIADKKLMKRVIFISRIPTPLRRMLVGIIDALRKIKNI